MTKIICILISLISYLSGQESIQSPSTPHIKSSIYNLYNYHFEAAIAALDSAEAADPDHPVQPFIRLAVKWLQAQTQSGFDKSYKVIEDEFEVLLPWYKKQMALHKSNPEYPLYLGSVYGMKARIALAKKKWLDVIISGYQGYTYINAAREIDPGLKDIQMPYGLMEYYTCKMPEGIRFIAELFGIEGDCRTGLDKLEIAASQSYYSWIESSNVLVYAYLYIEKDYESALKWILPLQRKFPDNPLFLLLYAETLAKTENWQELEKILPRIYPYTVRGPENLKIECRLKYTYIRALKEFNQQNFSSVIVLTTEIINTYEMEFDWLLGLAHILRGKCYDITGQRSKAVSDYKITASLDNKYPEVEESELLIEHPYIFEN